MIARDVEDFYIAVARRIDLNMTPLVTFIRVEGRLVAASLNAVGASLMECLVITHDPAFRRYSPGILLLFYQAGWAFEAGFEFDMVRHDTDVKIRWANHIAVSRRHAIFFAPNSVTGFATFVGLAVNKIRTLCVRGARSVSYGASAGGTASGVGRGNSGLMLCRQACGGLSSFKNKAFG